VEHSYGCGGVGERGKDSTIFTHVMNQLRYFALTIPSGVSADFLKVKFPVVICHVLTVYFITYMFTVCS